MSKEKINFRAYDKGIKNKVTIKGTLKETNLEFTQDAKGDDIVRGTVQLKQKNGESVIANYYYKKYNAKGELSGIYSRLEELDAEKSIAKLMNHVKEDGSRYTIEEAREEATKVTILGSLESSEYVKDGKTV